MNYATEHEIMKNTYMQVLENDVKNIGNIREENLGYKYRKIQSIQDGLSLAVVIPKAYAVNMGLTKDGFVKVSQQKDKIIVEKA